MPSFPVLAFAPGFRGAETACMRITPRFVGLYVIIRLLRNPDNGGGGRFFRWYDAFHTPGHDTNIDVIHPAELSGWLQEIVHLREFLLSRVRLGLATSSRTGRLANGRYCHDGFCDKKCEC